MSRGFTFIEVMIVVFLMSLIIGITTVFFGNTLPSARQRAAARELAATIKYARNLAFAKNEKQMIDIDLNGKSYSLNGGKAKSISPEIIVTIYDANTNFNPIREGQYVIAYDTTGSSGWSKITLSRGEKTFTIKADPIMTALTTDGKKDGTGN